MLKTAIVVAGIGVVAIGAMVVAINLVWAAQHTEAIKKAKSLDSKGQYSSEIQYLQDYVATNPPQQYRYGALVSEGKAAIKGRDYHRAYQAYLAADVMSSKPSLEVKLGVAQAAAAIGETKLRQFIFTTTRSLWCQATPTDQHD